MIYTVKSLGQIADSSSNLHIFINGF